MEGLQYDVEYLVTNETLDAIMTGLEVNPEDDILSLCASGDQAFAFLEVAKHVRVIDMEQRNIDRFRKRVELLRQRDYPSFLNVDLERNGYANIGKRNKYFREEGRLDRIRTQLGRLDILGVGDIVLAASTNRGFNKLYVSNAIGCFEYYTPERIAHALGIIASSLPKDGLVYIAGHYPTWESLAPSELCLDDGLIKKSEKLEEEHFWAPRVFRKVA